MKRVAAILLLLAFTTQLLSKLSLMTWYQLNKQYIAKTYCVNKAKPQMHCNGQCHLQKQLKKQDEQPGKPQAPHLKDIHESVVFFESNTIGKFVAKHNFNIQTNYCFSINSSKQGNVFHPPC